MKVTPSLLHEVAQDNRTANQIGDNIEDGVGWDVGEAMGYMRPEEAAVLPISPEAAGTIGSVALAEETAASESGRRGKKLTIAQKNENERRHIAETRRLYPK